MLTLTSKALMGATATERDEAFQDGYAHGLAGKRDTRTPATIIRHREAVGFRPLISDMLTAPADNMKLDKAFMETYGLTLAHGDMSGYRACPWIGECGKVCVLNNGNGRYASVQLAWLWRTNFLAEDTADAIYRIGWELGRAVRKHGEILFRPNVNSDVLWHKVIPSLGGMEKIHSYGYSKNPAVLRTDGWQGGIRIAYSWNESTDGSLVVPFVANGGSVAVVTNRKPGTPIDADAVRKALGMDSSVNVADADLTDEWMLAPSTIGDLSAKGKARDLIGSSGFVVLAY